MPTTSEQPAAGAPIQISLAVFAWNEERALPATLQSLFGQSLFGELRRRGCRAEVLCVANGCSDHTPQVAQEVFDRQMREHPHAAAFVARPVSLLARGKVNAWNQFVHTLSARSAEYLFMMDADILIHRPETLWNMLAALEQDPRANVAVDRPCKDILFKEHKTWRERLSLAAARMTSAASAQLCGQLYCIRAETARRIFLPRDLAACEDGFIKTLVCTDFLAHGPLPERIRLAEGAEHTFEAYTSPAAILKNQKRQVIGQTIVHLLVDSDLAALPSWQRQRLADTLKAREASDPSWLKRRISEHLRRTRFFWRLYPGLAVQPFHRLAGFHPLRRVALLPAAAAASGAALVGAFLAWRSLKAGCTTYWPRAARTGFKSSVNPPSPIPL
jgi:glycosyltransferase involved in cell wall biosynthesis